MFVPSSVKLHHFLSSPLRCWGKFWLKTLLKCSSATGLKYSSTTGLSSAEFSTGKHKLKAESLQFSSEYAESQPKGG